MGRISGGYGRGGSGGGIRQVARLPAPKRGQLAYVKADYQEGGPYAATDFDLTIIAGANALNNRIGYGAAGQTDGAAGSLETPVPGLTALVYTTGNGTFHLRFDGEYTALLGGFDNLFLRIGTDQYTLVNRGDLFQSETDANRLAVADRWAAGEEVTFRIFTNAGGTSGLTPEGLRAIGDPGSPRGGDLIPQGFYHVDEESSEWVHGIGAGGGLSLRSPPDEFSHANRAGAEAARDAAITNVAATLAEFDANPNLAIILTITGTNPKTTVWQVRRGGDWADVTGAVRGPGGAPGSAGNVTAVVAAVDGNRRLTVAVTNSDGSTVTSDPAVLPAAAAGGGGGGGGTGLLFFEIGSSASLTNHEALAANGEMLIRATSNFTHNGNAVKRGDVWYYRHREANGVISEDFQLVMRPPSGVRLAVVPSPAAVDKANLPGQWNVTLFFPANAYPTATKAKVIFGGVEQTVALARAIGESGTEVVFRFSITPAMRAALVALGDHSLTSLVVALLDADDLELVEADVGIGVLPGASHVATVVSKAADYQLVEGDRGNTIRFTGNAARRATVSVLRSGWWCRLLNTTSADLIFDVGVAGRIEGAGQTATVPEDEAITVQYLGASTWAILTNTEKGAGGDDSGSGATPRDLELVADARSTAVDSGAVSGEANLVFPATYTEYRNWEIVVGDDNNTIDTLRGRNAWLAEQQDSDNIRFGFLDKDEAGSRQWLTWTPSTRTWDFGKQGTAANNVRIKAARLYDNGGGGSGEPGEIPDDSITPIKAMADEVAQKQAWRARFGSARITAGDTLPTATERSVNDFHVFTQDVAAGLVWSNLADGSNLTAAMAGDVGLATARGWLRLGNFIRGNDALRASIDAIEAQLASLVIPGPSVTAHKLGKGGPRGVQGDWLVRIQNPPAGTNRLRIVMQGGVVQDWAAYVHDDEVLTVVTVDATTATNIRNNAGANGYLTVQALFRQDAGATVADPEGIGILPSFESPVGASPAVLPRGTHTIDVLVVTDAGTNAERQHSRQVLVSRLGAEKRWIVESGNARDPNVERDVAVDLTYVPATRTLTYAKVGSQGDVGAPNIIAIGES
ncbi:MAG: hypothetical protein OXE53_13125 [Deltaproteobacteria bacterium]|nr:hypothetical protein [Deltaproteobacteria bacterium]